MRNASRGCLLFCVILGQSTPFYPISFRKERWLILTQSHGFMSHHSVWKYCWICYQHTASLILTPCSTTCFFHLKILQPAFRKWTHRTVSPFLMAAEENTSVVFWCLSISFLTLECHLRGLRAIGAVMPSVGSAGQEATWWMPIITWGGGGWAQRTSPPSDHTRFCLSHVTACLPYWEMHMWVLEWDGSQVTSSFPSFVSSFVPWQLWRRGPSSTLISKVFLVNGLLVWSPWGSSVVWRGGLFPRGVKTGSTHTWIWAELGPHSCDELEGALSQVVLEVKNLPA